MRLFIPEIGTKLRLTKPWTFRLFSEERNETLFKRLGLEMAPRYVPRGDGTMKWNDRSGHFVEATLPAGTLLTVDRVYIRHGASDYSSLTFRMPKEPIKGAKFKKCVRFWAKLADVNRIHAVVVKEKAGAS